MLQERIEIKIVIGIWKFLIKVEIMLNTIEMKAELWRIHKSYSKWRVKSDFLSSTFLSSIYSLQKTSGGGGFMIGPPPLGCRREVPPLIDRVGWLGNPGSSS